jgi:hypothetical protein
MPRGKASDKQNEILAYALRHLEQERDAIQEKIDLIHRQLGNSKPAAAPAAGAASSAAPAAPRKKRVLSAAARKRIAAAQKKRWAEHRKQKSDSK